MPVETLDDGQKVLVTCNRICKLRVSGYRDLAVIPPAGFVASREKCNCTAISILDDGSCSCSPGDLSNPPTLRAIEK